MSPLTDERADATPKATAEATPDARARLAARQAELVAALVDGAPAPEGFDEARLRHVAESLASKRSRSAARAWPRLAEELGERWRELFARHVEPTPACAEYAPLADGLALARALDATGELPRGARLETMAVELRYRTRTDGRGLARRRSPSIRAARLPTDAEGRGTRLVVAVRVPPFGERWFAAPKLRRS